jgi:hypothetical protein
MEIDANKYARTVLLSLCTLSVISFLLNCFTITHRINTALYAMNIFCLLGFSWLLWKNPVFFEKRYGYLTLHLIDARVFHFVAFIFHILPLWIFRNRQSITEIFHYRTFIDAAIMVLAYFAVFHVKLAEMYGITPLYAAKLTAAIFGIFAVGCVSFGSDALSASPGVLRPWA